jgi:hypothetical protein
MAFSFLLTPILLLCVLGLGTVLEGLTSLLTSSFLTVDLSQKSSKFGFVILLKFVELVGMGTNASFKVSSVTLIPLTEVRSLLFVQLTLSLLESI